MVVPGVGQLGGCLEAALARHADVEEQHVGLLLQGLRHGGCAVADHGDHLQLGPGAGQFRLQRGRQQRLVFGDQGSGRAAGVHAGLRSGSGS